MFVVDAMHAFFLGLVSHEVDLIFGDSHRHAAALLHVF